MTHNKSDDYVFRFRLQPDSSIEDGQDPLIETVRSFLEEFLKIGFLTYKEERVPVDGFALLNDQKKAHRIFSEDEETGQ
jgi:hypothetical protein